MSSESIAIAANGEAALEELKRRCKWIASSGLVPEHFAKNPQSIAVAIDLARSLGEDPILLMQGVFFISGKPGFGAAFMLSRLRRSGAIKGTVRYETTGAGDEMRVRAHAIDAETGEAVSGPEVSLDMAKAEGWTKNGKWRTIPEVMLRKRAVTFLVRDHYPDVLAGMPVVDELEDVRAAGAMRVNGSSSAVEALNAQIAGELSAPNEDGVLDLPTLEEELSK
jgi:hypothetical protein